MRWAATRLLSKKMDHKADYLIAIQNNQKSLYEEAENLFTMTKPFSEHTASRWIMAGWKPGNVV